MDDMKKQRLDYFDIAKGISMICIIMGHMGLTKVNSFVYTFHVPIFFLISGYFLNDKISIGKYVKKKIKQLFIPYWTTCAFIIVGIILNDTIQYKSLYRTVNNIHIWIIASLYGSGGPIKTQPVFVEKQIGALWFLPALFFACMIVRLFLEYKYSFIWILAIAYIGYKSKEFIWLPMSIQAGMLASLFVYLGGAARKEDIMEQKVSFPILSVLAGTWLLCVIYGGQFYLVENYLGNGLMDILGALAASYIVVFFSKIIGEKNNFIIKILKFIGENSLYILCIHAFELKVLSWNWIKDLLGETSSEIFVSGFIFLAKLIFCLTIAWVLQNVKKFGLAIRKRYYK